MRDDIHKRVPRPPKVRLWVKRALREADRVCGQTRAALGEAVREACGEISNGFLRCVRRHMTAGHDDLFGALGGVSSPRELGGNGGPMERTILADCQRAAAGGKTLDEALTGAMAEALKERSLADIRAAEAVLLPTRDPEAIRAVAQMKADVESFDYRAAAAEQLGLRERGERSAPALSPDENLLGSAVRGR